MSLELIELLENCAGADQEVDLKVNAWACRHIRHWKEVVVPPDFNGENSSVILVPPTGMEDVRYPNVGKISEYYFVPRDPVTGSIDAALKLIGHMGINQVNFHSHVKDRQKCTAKVGYMDGSGVEILVVEGFHKNSVAIAMLIAFLKFKHLLDEMRDERSRAEAD